MKTLLLLTDFSESATNAIHYALQFFKDDQCKCYVMHVHKAGSFISDDLMVSPQGNIYESITSEPKHKLDTLISELKTKYKNLNHSFETVIDFDVFTDAIKQAIKAYSIDILVMGSNGKTGALEVVFGSNTINVIRKISCKTLIIPTGHKYKPISNFLLPLQCQDIINNEQLHTIESFNKYHDFKLHILRVCEENNTKAKYDLKHLEAFDWEYIVETNQNFFDAVSAYLDKHDIGICSLIAHDTSVIKRLLTDTPELKLSKVIKLPLFIFHT